MMSLVFGWHVEVTHIMVFWVSEQTRSTLPLGRGEDAPEPDPLAVGLSLKPKASQELCFFLLGIHRKKWLLRWR